MKAKAYLPAELASQDIAQSRSFNLAQSGCNRYRRLYTAVMYGGEAHAYDNDIPTAQVTEEKENSRAMGVCRTNRI